MGWCQIFKFDMITVWYSAGLFWDRAAENGGQGGHRDLTLCKVKLKITKGGN